MKNYICINGNKTELTPEQLKQLGIELPKVNPFARAEKYTNYYTIDTGGVVRDCNERNDGVDSAFYGVGNYCTDKSIMEQRALHETLNRLLWRYSMEHDGDKIDIQSCVMKYGVKRCYDGTWNTYSTNARLFGVTMFYTKEIAENAIEKIVKPFLEAHPDFKF